MSESSFLSVVDDLLQVRIYAKKVDDMTIATASGSLYATELQGKALTLVWVYGVKLAGQCKRLPHRVIAVVPGDGVPPSGCDEFPSQEGYLMWLFPKNSPLAVLSYDVGTAAEIVDRLLEPVSKPFENSERASQLQ